MFRYLRYITAVGDQHPVLWEVQSEESEESELYEDNQELSLTSEEGFRVVTYRTALRRLYSSERFQVVVVCLVVLDAMFVLAEMLLDMSIIKLDDASIFIDVFHYLSLALLTIFLLELTGKLFAFRLEFFLHKFEVFDGLVVLVSFTLDLLSVFDINALDIMGLLILLRLWRVARIINGIVTTVRVQASLRLQKMKESYDFVVARATELQEICDQQKLENERLDALLKRLGIDVPTELSHETLSDL